jgi:hypothetical protein
MVVLSLGCTSSGGIIKSVPLSLLIAFLWLKCKMSICVFLIPMGSRYSFLFLKPGICYICLLVIYLLLYF